MRVLLLSEFFLSGQTTHVLDLAEQLQSLGLSVHVRFARIHTPLFEADYAPRLKERGISVSTGPGAGPLSTLFRRWRPDVIHAHSSTLFALANRLATRLQVPAVFTCHGLGLSRRSYQRELSQAACVIAVGKNVAQEIAPFCRRLVIIPNGVNTAYYVPPPGNFLRDQLVYIARMDRSKIPALVQLARIYNSYFQRCLTVIADRNPEVPGTIYQPWKADLLPTLQQSGIVAASGRTAREALACGNAVLLVQSRYDGLIGPALTVKSDFDFSGNHGRFPFSRLRDDLAKLLYSRTALPRLQAWSRKYAEENLSSAKMARAVVDVYAAVQSTASGPRHLPRRIR